MDLLNRFLEENGLSRKDGAKVIGVGYRQFCRYVNRERQLPRKRQQRIYHIMDMTKKEREFFIKTIIKIG